MQSTNFTRKSLILGLALAVASCNSTVGADSTGQTNSIPVANDHTQKVKALAQKYPPLYRVSWNVCGVQKRVSIGRSVNNQCVDSATQTMLVWAATGAHKLIPTHQYTGGIQSHLFIESKGCFGVSEPSQSPQFFKTKSFIVGRFKYKDTLPKPKAEVKVTELSQQEKENVISEFISSPPDTVIAGISDNYDCQSEAQWTQVYKRAIPATY
ncbi:hypothetical protein [Nostoc sp. FACHB-145]|uniref:hypothetical protein n=1 Tax=Nostoc sp. FACHB-145 TaxID=2692836 RepID=UPI001683E2BA|nr:hypothetical protein [Nostoc sp. FACHB-145]MBD2472151.1 hypothetical protein [Nostoc sp. FACHB-145]